MGVATNKEGHTYSASPKFDRLSSINKTFSGRNAISLIICLIRPPLDSQLIELKTKYSKTSNLLSSFSASSQSFFEHTEFTIPRLESFLTKLMLESIGIIDGALILISDKVPFQNVSSKSHIISLIFEI